MTETIQSKIKRAAPIDETVPTFIKKTFDILEDRKFPEIIDWNPEGTALIIKNPTEFCKKVLPAYFKHNNLTSFIRQLNMYNFHKRRTQDIDHIYFHELFQKGKRHLLKEIKRKNNEHFHTLQKTIDTLESMQTSQDNPGIGHENLVLKKLNRDSLSRIAALEKKMKDLTIQNQALWNQIYSQNEREDVLKSLLNNLLTQFNIPVQDLPSLVKRNPKLLVPNKEAETQLIRTISSEKFLDAINYQDQPDRPQDNHDFTKIDDFLGIGNYPASDQFGPPSKLISLIETKPIDFTSKDFIQNDTATNNEFDNSVFPYINKGEKPSKPYHSWNLESDYLKALGTTDNHFNTPFANTLDGKDSGVLSKRSLDHEPVERKPFKFRRLGSIAHLGEENAFLRFETPSGPLFSGKKSRLNEFQDPKREGLDLNQSLDLMDFTGSGNYNNSSTLL